MYSFSSLSASSLLRANIRQDVALVFVSYEESSKFFQNIQKYTYILTAFVAFFSFLPMSGYAAAPLETKELVVTAYYSPLPGQSFYLRGNYEAEKVLNGNGTHGASGKPVFAGMIAAPKSYSFWTRLDFEWMGVGIVEDRGGAIVAAWEKNQTYDRIDIWMGYGEAGLRRAMIWWKRKVKAKITQDSGKKVFDFMDIDTGKIDLSQFPSVWVSPSGTLDSVILGKFADLGYTLDGRSTKELIISFQIDHNIIASEKDDGAGTYGPRTQASLATEHTRYLELRNAEFQKIEAEKALLISEKTDWENAYKVTSQKILSFQSPVKGEQWIHVRELQKTLKTSGYFRWKDTGVMGVATIAALKSLQRSHGLTATGTLDTRTKEVLVEVIMEKIS